MGYTRCAILDCRSRPGSGKLFKYFPTRQNLAEAWLSKLPLGFKVTKSTAICEDHFDSSQFEKPRQDGKKKLKDSAVPNISSAAVKIRKPFGELKNVSNVPAASLPKHVIQEHSYHRSTIFVPDSTLNMKENVNPLLTHQSENDSKDCSGVKVCPDSENNIAKICPDDASQKLDVPESDLTFDPSRDAFHSTLNELDISEMEVAHSLSSCSMEVTMKNDSDLVLDECNGNLYVKPTKPMESSLKESEVHFIAAWSDGAVILDEVTGHFKYSSSDGMPLAGESCSNLVSENEKPNIGELIYVNERDNAIGRAMELYVQQQAEINRLRKAQEEKEEIILKLRNDLDVNGTFGVKWKLKYEAARKSKERLEKKVQRNSYSPRLSQSQISRLQRKSSRGMKWSMEEIKEGLIHKVKCGSTGYSRFVKKYPVLPSLRTLQESMQFIRFNDKGLLHEVFDLIQSMVGGMSEKEKDCNLVLDEMAIKEGDMYDNTLKKWVGQSTLPTHTGPASKALVLLLAGVYRRWKIAVAVYFTGKRDEESKQKKEDNLTGKAYCDITDEVLIRSHEVGLYVNGVSSDMGPENLSMWKARGVNGGRNKEVNPTFPHPGCNDFKVHILPDAVHLQKAVKTMMENNVTITLPPSIVEEEGLPTGVVNYKHIDDLFDFEDQCELKVAFRLREENIHCKKQFKKMKVSTTKAVLCHRTGVGLKLLAKEMNDPTYETTGWFIILLNTFFTLVCCRSKGLAVTKSNPTSFDKAIALIKKVEFIFHHMKVGKGSEYKPAQRGVRVLCASLLSLIEHFLGERNYSYLMLGHFTSDCIESLFACIRLSQPVPHVTAFLQCLKAITLSQFSEAVRGSSYEHDESTPLSDDFLEEARKRAKERAMLRFYDSIDELSQNVIRKLTPQDYLILNRWECCVVYDMAGSAIQAVKSNMSVCGSCIDWTKWKGEEPHTLAVITDMKEFTLLRADDNTRALQFFVSDAVYQAILTAEISFRLYRERTLNFRNADVKAFFVDNLMYVWNQTSVPKCHDLGRKILSTYFDGRLKQFGQKRREKVLEENRPKSTIEKSSKSIAMRQAADQVTVSGAQQKTV